MTAADLRQAGQARPHVVPSRLLGGIAVEVFRQQRTRADETHLALEDVPQLGQLVDARPAQERSKPGDASSVGCGILRAVGRDHGPELDQRERTSVESRPHLAKEDRSSHRRPDAQSHHAHERREHHEADHGNRDVDEPLEAVLQLTTEASPPHDTTILRLRNASA